MNRFFSLFKSQKKQNTREFSGAQGGRLLGGWNQSFLSQDGEIRFSLKQLRNRSRDLGRNNDYIRAFLRSVENNVVGRGINLQSAIKDREDLNRAIELEWKKWCSKDSCHAGGTLSFADIERMVIRNVPESGEILVRMIPKKMGRSKVALCLQVIEADQLDENFNGEYNGNPVRMGVELDPEGYGRPVAYHFLSVHPGDTSFKQPHAEIKRIRVEAKWILHLFRSERPLQSRGIPWLASSLPTLKHLDGFIEASVVRKRAEASRMGVITSPDLDYEGPMSDGVPIEDFDPGKIFKLGPGEKFEVTDNGSGSESEYAVFVESMIRKTATGVGSSFEEISKDYSKSNYSSSRLALISERDNWKTIQDWMIKNFHQPIFEMWLDLLFMSGVIQMPKDYLLNELDYNQPRWLRRGWDWVDPLKDVSADKEALSSHIKSFSEVLAEEGKDFEEHFTQIAKEKDFIKSLGLNPDVYFKNPNSKPQMKGDINEDEDPKDTKKIS